MNSELHPTCIARVSHVLGATITAKLNPDLVGVYPLWRGHLQPVGQVGSIVAIPQGPVRLLATVVLVGLSELSEPQTTIEGAQKGDRWLRLQLLGELDALGDFHRGVSLYPGLDDPVHFVSPEILTAIHPAPTKDSVAIGSLAANAEVPVTLDIRKLVTRHSVLVCSTGAGKTSAVATIIQNLVRTNCTSANVIIIDPHGEYSQALSDDASVRSVTADEQADRLRVPYWALPASDLLSALAGPGTISVTAANRFAELVGEARVAYATVSDWIDDVRGVSADTPIPFDIWGVWHTIDSENNATCVDRGGPPAPTDAGDARSLRPASFKPHSPNNTAPYKCTSFGLYATVPDRIRSRLADKQFTFFLESATEILDSDPLEGVIGEWLGGDRPVSVLDFSGIPAEVADLAIGVILQLLFEVSIRSTSEHGIGRHRPTLVVIEEAHRYLSGEAGAQLASQSANRIAREGRKYGIGLMLVSQRPSELPDTAFSQAGTTIALRLTNASDQGKVKSSLPDSLAGLAEALPSLRTGEALVTGEAVRLPSRVIIDLPNPEPHADDPTLSGWQMQAQPNDITEALAKWRGTQSVEVPND
jgi:hypothetical protein